ncbi:hypothetical protein [Leptospira interrogans]|uniref:PF06252 family protein n=1 Tax=Leptospira interrogans str. UI 12758 TaxID=1049938 RepID=A0A0E2D4K0_LEPIR|nr:hypothetical protein [Leptospira interrogans]EKR54490.1 hypothetical protein LEP1GSC105_2906 [Leptospira interrogans str. UI 12758]
MTPDITTAQIRKIWITAREKGISSELLHSMIFEITKKESVKELNIKEAGKVIERICGKRRARKRCEPSGSADQSGRGKSSNGLQRNNKPT